MTDQGEPSTSFVAFSRRADELASRGNSNSRSGLSASFKALGIDTGRMAERASDYVDDWQEMLVEEIRARPLRAVGWAAMAGLVVGLRWSRR